MALFPAAPLKFTQHKHEHKHNTHTGVFLVLCGYVITGLLLEGFGALNLFGNFVPTAYRVCKSMPVIGMSTPPHSVKLVVFASVPTHTHTPHTGTLLCTPFIENMAYKAGLDTLPS